MASNRTSFINSNLISQNSKLPSPFALVRMEKVRSWNDIEQLRMQDMISNLGRPFTLPIQVTFVKPSKAMNRPWLPVPGNTVQ